VVLRVSPSGTRIVTVMETKEPLLRTDWAIYPWRGLFVQGREDCLLEEPALDQ